MTLPYVPPGVKIQEAVSPQVTPLLSSAADICLVGLTSGFQTRTDQFVLSGTSEVQLPTLAALPNSKLLSVLSVTDVLTPSKGGSNNGTGYVLTTDYTVNTNTGSISRVNSGGIADKTLINVTYRYVPADYYNPVRLFNINEVQNRFGNGIDTVNEAIGSPLSLAALLAFQNGAENVICQPLFFTSSGSVEYNQAGFITNAAQPTAPQSAVAATWGTSLQALQVVEALDIIVPVIGQSQSEVNDAAVLGAYGAVQNFQQLMNQSHQYVVGIFGEDSSAGGGEATMTTIRSHTQALQGYAGGALSAQNVMINTSNFSLPLPTNNNTLAVGGQYMAAAVAGAIAARPVAASLTRKTIIGFNSVLDLRTPNDKNLDAGNGEMVIEQIGGIIRCRHALTLDNKGGASRSELSVVRAKFLMVESVKQTLENQIIGQIIADANSPIIVRSAIVGVLGALQSAGDLVDYSAPVCQISKMDPTTITASFSYRPAFTLNYIDVTFALDLSNQTVALVDTNTSSNL